MHLNNFNLLSYMPLDCIFKFGHFAANRFDSYPGETCYSFSSGSGWFNSHRIGDLAFAQNGNGVVFIPSLRFLADEIGLLLRQFKNTLRILISRRVWAMWRVRVWMESACEWQEYPWGNKCCLYHTDGQLVSNHLWILFLFGCVFFSLLTISKLLLNVFEYH